MMMKVVQHRDERTAAVASAWLAEHTQQFHSTRRRANEPRETSTQHHTQFIIVQQGIQQRFLFKEKNHRKNCVLLAREKRRSEQQKASSHFCKY